MRREIKLPRFVHRVYAGLNAYFWLPCPICGRMFGGHEEKGMLYKGWHGGVSVCSNCIEIAEKRNKEYWDAQSPIVIEEYV